MAIRHAPEYMCQYGNCTETGAPLPVVITEIAPGGDKTTKRYCSDIHGAAALLNRAEFHAMDINKRLAVNAVKQPVVKLADSFGSDKTKEVTS